MKELTKDELELAKTYAPIMMFDEREPYDLIKVGITIFTESGKSPSSGFQIRLNPGERALEYAFYYDFDIQHLYDLEHVFVKIDEEGKVISVTSSFHGKFFNSMLKNQTAFKGKRIVLYVQPGKHAFMPTPELFDLFPDGDEPCLGLAGIDGLLVAPMFEGQITTDESVDRKVKEYIQKNHTFVPSWHFAEKDLLADDAYFDTWGNVSEQIVTRINEWKMKILEEN